MSRKKKRNEPVAYGRHGRVEIPIHAVTHKKGDARYQYYRFSYVLNGLSLRKQYSALDEATAEANRIAKQLNAGNAPVTDIDAATAAVAIQSVNKLTPFGVGLAAVVEEWIATRAVLGDRYSMLTAAQDYVKRQSQVKADRTVEAVVIEFLAEKKSTRKGDRTVRALSITLKRFTNDFGAMDIRSVDYTSLKKWILSLTVKSRLGKPTKALLSERTRRNVYNDLKGLFLWAREQRYLPKDWDELVGKRKLLGSLDPGVIEFFTPDEWRRLLARANDVVFPALILGGYAGARTSEIEDHIRWEHVDLDSDEPNVRLRDGKTGGRKIPLSPAAVSWLRLHRKPSGPVYSGKHLAEAFAWLAEASGVPWKHNGLRHSFITYQVAMTKNLAAVAYDSGNSESIIRKHYDGRANKSMAVEFFGIRPAGAEKITSLAAHA